MPYFNGREIPPEEWEASLARARARWPRHTGLWEEDIETGELRPSDYYPEPGERRTWRPTVTPR